jgi:NMD protein affecting ribosome stability and mRNA decay
MKPTTQRLGLSRLGRRLAGRAQQDGMLDPYRARQKLKEPAGCRQCGAVYHNGRWQWTTELVPPKEDVCPACRRIEDGLPAGILTLHGDFARRHENEILNLARHEETAEKAEHPLNRIANIERTDTGLVIATTDTRLPRRIGEAIKRAYRGTLDMHFDDAAYFVRADWRAPS